VDDALRAFGAATAEWFHASFGAPTPAQAGAWQAIASGDHALVVAPTGSGKTLAAFLWALDGLTSEQEPEPGPAATRVLYVSPLKALAVDVERNLQAPLVGIARTAERLGLRSRPVTVGIRSGDTLATERRALTRNPPDVLITTPESLYLMLTSAARQTLRQVRTVIVDEIHVLAAGKRGAHLALSLERLDALLDRPAQRIGLSATVRPAEEVARFLGGSAPVRIVAPPASKDLELRIVVPVEDMMRPPPRSDRAADTGSAARSIPVEDGGGAPAGPTIWPHIEEDLLDRILEHRSTIVFANSRGLAERVTARLNELHAEREGRPLGEQGATRTPAVMGSTGSNTRGAEAVIARAHHGSVSKEQRALIEEDLKSGRLRCVVATSSLELGIDMGAVDLVVQLANPPSVASAMQRIGRAGHQVGEVSRGLLYPRTRLDLVGAAVTVSRMREGRIEELRVPANPLDVLAQQTVAAAALEPLDVEDWYATVRRSAPFASLPRSAYEATLDLLSGRYPSADFGELRPRLVWDRDAGTLSARPGAQRLAVTSGGTIPDRGQFGVFLEPPSGERPAGGLRVGELDEEMVYESRVNDVFALGATSWRIRQITHDRVIVSPAPGQPGRLPFWHGEGPGRPAELGQAQGAFLRVLESGDPDALAEQLRADGMDENAAQNLLALIREQREATGRVPSDRTLIVERTRDELGDWRLLLHSPYGMNVHAPWALAVAARIRERYATDGNCVASDDGIVARVPDTDAEPPGAELFLFEAEELGELVRREVGASALFAARFRECSARALLLPRRDPGKRSPLWQQRQRAAQLLEIARDYPQFPMLLETAREVLQDVYDLPGLLELTRRLAAREIRMVEVQTERPSPFAQGLLFGYVAAFLYEGDSPLAERRAAALSLDEALLGELLGQVELRELLDAEVIVQTEAELQRLVPERRLRGMEGAADLLRILGPLDEDELAARLLPEREEDREAGPDVGAYLSALERSGRAIRATIGGVQRWAGVEDAGRLRAALGIPLPLGVPQAFQEGGRDPLSELLLRHARSHGPFTAAQAAERFGLGESVAAAALHRLARDGRLREGEFRPGGSGTEWVDPEVFHRLRNRSLAAVRKAVEPVEAAAFARFLPQWQGVGAQLRGAEGVLAVVEQLAGVPVPASAWETFVLPSRVAGYSPAMLDELTVAGEVLWSGAGALAGRDGWVCLHPAGLAPMTLRAPVEAPPGLAAELFEVLRAGGGHFLGSLSAGVAERTGTVHDQDELAEALWELVWSGLVSNDSLTPLRARLGPRNAHRAPQRAPRGRMLGSGRLGRLSRPGIAAAAAGPGSGRWFALPPVSPDPTERAHAMAELLLERYGVVTRGSVQSEGVPGGFAAAYRVLAAFEQAGRVVRGYVVEGLGAAQFATSGAVDRLRGYTRLDREAPSTASSALVLAASDPANPYGAALPWPEPPAGGHRPGRKAGALVVLRDGALVLYLERGGRSALLFQEDQGALADAAAALAALAAARSIGRITVESVNGEPAAGSPLAAALVEAGFHRTPKGVRLDA